jgi:hypothetical protein
MERIPKPELMLDEEQTAAGLEPLKVAFVSNLHMGTSGYDTP